MESIFFLGMEGARQNEPSYIRSLGFAGAFESLSDFIRPRPGKGRVSESFASGSLSGTMVMRSKDFNHLETVLSIIEARSTGYPM